MRRAGRQARRHGSRLLFLRPSFWAAVYIAMVPLYALAYLTFFDGDFAQSNFIYNDPKLNQAAFWELGISSSATWSHTPSPRSSSSSVCKPTAWANWYRSSC